MKNIKSQQLKDGEKSRSVSEKIKRQVFVNGVGICAFPNCSERVIQDRTMLGECAHIIPRIVGSHPREDYMTSLEDRAKEANLLYLCEKHHKIVDDKQHAKLYTSEVLRQWKKAHEVWALGITKTSTSLPANFKSLLDGIGNSIVEQLDASEETLNQLLEACKELIQRQLIDSAKAFLSQINLILLDSNNVALNAKADLLNAMLLIQEEKIPDAKKKLIEIIQVAPDDIEAMLEYVELCENVPEADDDAEWIEQLARSLDPNHPKLMLIDLVRKYDNQEVPKIPDISRNWADDLRLNAAFMRQYALFCDLLQKTSQRDDFINRWESLLPNSPRPHLFRAFFRVVDTYRRFPLDSPVEQTELLQETMEFFNQEYTKAVDKDPLPLDDEISWLKEDLKLKLNLIDYTDANINISEIRQDIVSLIKRCYFDRFINKILIETLSRLRIEPTDWRSIVNTINRSKVAPFDDVIELLFLQALSYQELFPDLERFINQYSRDDLLSILFAIQEGSSQKIAEILNAKRNFAFSLHLLQSISESKVAVSLCESIEVDEDSQIDLLYTKVTVLDKHKLEEEVLALISTFPLETGSVQALGNIQRIAVRNQKSDMIVHSGLQLLNFDISQTYRTWLNHNLAKAYYLSGDATNAIVYSEKTLSNLTLLDETTSQYILALLGRCLVIKGLPDEACQKFQEYSNINRSFNLLLQEADAYWRSSHPNKHEKVLSLILQAFEEAKDFNDGLYYSAFTLLVDLGNAGVIALENEPVVEDGLFIKISDFSNEWFYIGGEKGLGAKCLKLGTLNYEAVIHKHLGEEIEWPSDRFSSPKIKRKILSIVKAPAFLSQRVHEIVENMAHMGDEGIWSVRIVQEDDSIDLDNLKKFLEEQFSLNNEFFNTYVNEPLPFAFLCQKEGGIARAISRIISERRGFIRINDGTLDAINLQAISAREVLMGADCFIDGLSCLMLVEANLLETVTNVLPNLGVSTSVIGMLREMAARFDDIGDREGIATIQDGNIKFFPLARENEAISKRRLLEAAELLDRLPNKVIGRIYHRSEDDRNLDDILPNYFVDAFRYSQEKGTHLLIDDAMLVKAYEIMGEKQLPKHFSSLNLIRAMADNRDITWDAYLRYFSLISFHRYHFLPIFADDMLSSIFPTTESGLAGGFNPKNILFFNLQLTLSESYGVNDQTAVKVIGDFFNTLIRDESVASEFADEIFALTITQGLAKRDNKQIGKVLFQMCYQYVSNLTWVSENSEKKLSILDRQLSGFAIGITPMVIESPALLKLPSTIIR